VMTRLSSGLKTAPVVGNLSFWRRLTLNEIAATSDCCDCCGGETPPPSMLDNCCWFIIII
jgi:hypothetical protein